MKKRIVAGTMAAAMLFAMPVFADSKKEVETENETTAEDQVLEDITVVLDWTPNTNHTGLYVALENGYYEKAGLNVTIIQPPEDGATTLVASGKAQFGVDAQDTIAPAFAKEDPLPVTAVAALIQHNTSGIISRKGDGMETPSGMEGKTYATWDNPVELATLRDVVEQDGGDFDQVNLIPNNITDEAAALQMKEADAIWVFYGWGKISSDLREVETDFFFLKDYGDEFDYYTPVLTANNEFLEEEPDTVKAFLKATQEGYEFAIENPEEAAEILCKADDSLDKALVIESQKWLADEYVADADAWGVFEEERWNGFYQWLWENKLIEVEIPENFGFSNDYLTLE